MKPRPRFRKTIKWGGAAVTVLLVAVWVGSAVGQVTLIRFPYIISVYSGGLNLTIAEDAAPSWPRVLPLGNCRFNDKEFHLSWWRWGGRYANAHEYAIPLWVVIAGSGLVTAIAWRLDILARRRAKLNLCPKCNYDRTGLAPSAVCPECGTAPAQP
jgi:hypothetical protein